MNILVLTSPRYHHVLRGFSFQFSKYWNSPIKPTVVVASPGSLASGVHLPGNFHYVKMGEHEQYPVERWSNFLLDFLNKVGWKRFVFFLEDFWLMRPVDVASVDKIYQYCESRDNIIRFDLTSDRLHAAPYPDIVDHGYLGHLDIIRSNPNSQYHISTQAAVWNADLLRKILVPDENPWQFEINGTYRSTSHDFLVLGTRQRPIRYAIVMHGGDPNTYHPEGLVPHEGLWAEDRKRLAQEGFLAPL